MEELQERDQCKPELGVKNEALGSRIYRPRGECWFGRHGHGRPNWPPAHSTSTVHGCFGACCGVGGAPGWCDLTAMEQNYSCPTLVDALLQMVLKFSIKFLHTSLTQWLMSLKCVACKKNVSVYAHRGGVGRTNGVVGRTTTCTNLFPDLFFHSLMQNID
jgi:hypothetical protein